MGCFPSGVISVLVNPNWTLPAGNCTAFPAELGPGWSLFALIFPNLEQQALNNSINFSLPIADPSNQTVRETRIATYLCPSDTGPDSVSDVQLRRPAIRHQYARADPLRPPPVGYVGILGGTNTDYPNTSGRLL